MLDSLSLYGKIISKDNSQSKGLEVQAYDNDPDPDSDDDLGKSMTDSNGMFRIDFDKSKFSKAWELFEGSPDVYLIIKDSGNQLLQTGVMQTQKEIEYHIKNKGDSDISDPNALDIYAGNPRRILSMLRDVGSILNKENQINLNMLQNVKLPEDIKKDIQNFVNENDDRSNNFRQIIAVLASFSDTILEELHIDDIGYDGPQVPRYPRHEQYNKVIIWPRNEAFKWA